MADWSDTVTAISAVGSLVCSGAVAFLTYKITHATVDMRDAAKAQARAAQATTLIQLGPLIGARIDRFIEDHRIALEKVERLIVDAPDLVSALIKADCGVDADPRELESIHVQALTVSEIIPNSVNGTTCGPKVFEASLALKPLSAKLQHLLKRSDGYDTKNVSVPRWGTGPTFVVDEAFSRSVYAALWPAIHDANAITHRAYYYDARDLLKEYISSDWRVDLAFALAETGYRTPEQHRRYKLDDKIIVVRGENGKFDTLTVEARTEVGQLDYTSVSMVG